MSTVREVRTVVWYDADKAADVYRFVNCSACGAEGEGATVQLVGFVAICAGCLGAIDRARVAANPGRAARFWFASSQILAALKAQLRKEQRLTLEQRDALEDGIAVLITKAKEHP
jgi:hypothetical protein